MTPSMRLLGRRATFEEYVRAMGGDTGGMTADRWGFISRNHTSDVTRDLRALRGVPVLLTLAGHDINVDIADTERGYREVLEASGALTVESYPDAAHSLLKQSVEQSDLKITLTALFVPRSLFADGFLDGQRQFLEELGRGGHFTHDAPASSGRPERPGWCDGPSAEAVRVLAPPDGRVLAVHADLAGIGHALHPVPVPVPAQAPNRRSVAARWNAAVRACGS